jgi:RNA polymerase sigma-70 factor (ECF subfamily)
MIDASQPCDCDEELARAAKRGDAVAFDVLVRRYLRPSLALACQYTKRLEDAEDVVQEAFHRAVRHLGRFDERRSFSAWFYAIVRNVARSASSRAGRRAAAAPITTLEDDPPAPSSHDPLLAGEIERAVAELSPMQQACLRLCDIEGFSSVEAARMLGVGEGTVRTHLHRARKHLRAEMDEQKGRFS